ncbi:hypothetical protein J3E71DRAFT_396032 [Bipolaris maydis]|nr:hypothetical protein J3E71DRAFT_396032 [Bipolaris maydis]
MHFFGVVTISLLCLVSTSIAACYDNCNSGNIGAACTITCDGSGTAGDGSMCRSLCNTVATLKSAELSSSILLTYLISTTQGKTWRTADMSIVLSVEFIIIAIYILSATNSKNY